MGAMRWINWLILGILLTITTLDGFWRAQHSSFEVIRRLRVAHTIVEDVLPKLDEVPRLESQAANLRRNSGRKEILSESSTHEQFQLESHRAIAQQSGNRKDNSTKSNGFVDFEFRQDKLVLAMIALGNATQGIHVQRLIRSARTRGQWEGRIAVITDNPDKYSPLVKKDPLVHLLRPRPQDWEGMPEFEHAKMKMKRFKTLLLDYILDDPGMADTQFVLYIDIDIVLTQPLVPWLQYKWDKGRENRLTHFSGLSSMYMFSEGTRKGKAAHSGIILMHRDLSQQCLRKWRTLMERHRDTAPRDQWIVRMIARDPRKMKCKIRTWTLNRSDLLFPKPKDLEQRFFPQFVHVTNTYRAQWIDADLQKAFFEDALLLTEEERRDPNSLAIVPKNF